MMLVRISSGVCGLFLGTKWQKYCNKQALICNKLRTMSKVGVDTGASLKIWATEQFYPWAFIIKSELILRFVNAWLSTIRRWHINYKWPRIVFEKSILCFYGDTLLVWLRISTIFGIIPKQFDIVPHFSLTLFRKCGITSFVNDSIPKSFICSFHE